jgi:hypothetical protein
MAHNKTAILDSGCSSHYLKRGAYCTNMRKTHMPLYVKLPDGKKLTSSATSDLNINVFNPQDRSAHIINALTTHSLLSCSQICDAGYSVVFDKDKARIIYGDVMVNGTVAMEGQRDQTTGLWTVKLDNKIQQVGSEYEKRRDDITYNVYKSAKYTIQYITYTLLQDPLYHQSS